MVMVLLLPPLMAAGSTTNAKINPHLGGNPSCRNVSQICCVYLINLINHANKMVSKILVTHNGIPTFQTLLPLLLLLLLRCLCAY